MIKKNKKKSAMSKIAACSLFGIIGIVAIAPMAQLANAEVTAPVGYVKLTFNAESDTPFSLPMNRPKVYSGQVASISENTISIADTDFTTDEFKYEDGTQNEKYYVLFTTGNLEGRAFDVTVNTDNSITVDPDWREMIPALKEDLESQMNNASSEDNFEIRPHWTLNTVFPSGEKFAKTIVDFFQPTGLLLVRNHTWVGTNAPTINYMYFDSIDDTQDGWYDADSGASGKQNDAVLRNTSLYVHRNPSEEVFDLNLLGDVPLTDHQINLRILAANTDQDNYASIAFPIERTLLESELHSSSSFAKTTDLLNVDGDRLLVYPDNPVGFNPPVTTYVYYDSDNDSEDGWYNADVLSAGKQGAIVMLKPGKGYIIRKEGAGEDSLYWKVVRPYNPFYEQPDPQ